MKRQPKKAITEEIINDLEKETGESEQPEFADTEYRLDITQPEKDADEMFDVIGTDGNPQPVQKSEISLTEELDSLYGDEFPGGTGSEADRYTDEDLQIDSAYDPADDSDREEADSDDLPEELSYGDEAEGEAEDLYASEAMPEEIPEEDDEPASDPKLIRRQRRRKRIDERVSLRMALVFFAFMVLIGIFLLVIPRSTISEIEKRQLTSWPTLTLADYFNGDYTGGITQYYDDTVPARDSFKNAGNNIKGLFGIKSANTIEVVGNITKVDDSSSKKDEPESDADASAQTDGTDADGTGENGDTADPDAVQETSTEPATEEEVINQKNYHVLNEDAIMDSGFLIAYQDGHWRGIILYGGLFESLYGQTVNYIRSVVDEDVNVYFMPCPLSAQFYLPSNYSEYFADENEVFEDGASQMAEGVICINIIDALDQHNEEPIYLRTDHHWAPLGGYYAAREFAEAAGVPFADLSTYTEYVNEGYVGSLYTYTESANLLNDPEDFVYYVPNNSYVVDYYDRAFNYIYSGGLFFDQPVSNSYCVFLGSDDIIAKVTTDVKNGRRLLIVKDSYGNAEVPFLTGSFEQIFVTDQRYFELNLIEFIEYNNITDILFTHNYFDLAGPEAELLRLITYENIGVPIYDAAPEPVYVQRSSQTEDTGEDTDPEETGTDEEVHADEEAYGEEDAYYEEEAYDDEGV